MDDQEKTPALVKWVWIVVIVFALIALFNGGGS